ncbi:MAG: hypothetical protein EZS28_037543 [Streblomastix strix]|uniref:Uncharacterized protein n=1 Tax=Streblomastix strix TaxID=222440 RepID=A0A5J4UAK3_9EUKA|nr:MAG: hypothetical protein EZS28_037543 [Streblomastix strix]
MWVTSSEMQCRVMEHHLQKGELTSPTLRNCVALPLKRSVHTEIGEEMEEQLLNFGTSCTRCECDPNGSIERMHQNDKKKQNKEPRPH